MTATAFSLASDEHAETIDFLRRLASMMSGGKNAEMLLTAASAIETLAHRAMTAERLYRDQQEASEQNNALREVAEIAADNLAAELTALQVQLAETLRQAEADRATLADEKRHVSAMVDQAEGRAADAENRLAKVAAELDDLRAPFTELSDTVVAVPVEQLRLARAQFEALADGFARNGDLISQTICEIGRCAIDQALTGGDGAKA